MDPLQLGIWAATVAGLSGLALAFFKSERLAVRLGALMVADESLEEIEINPVMVRETGAVAVDALIRRV